MCICSKAPKGHYFRVNPVLHISSVLQRLLRYVHSNMRDKTLPLTPVLYSSYYQNKNIQKIESVAKEGVLVRQSLYFLHVETKRETDILCFQLLRGESPPHYDATSPGVRIRDPGTSSSRGLGYNNHRDAARKGTFIDTEFGAFLALAVSRRLVLGPHHQAFLCVVSSFFFQVAFLLLKTAKF